MDYNEFIERSGYNATPEEYERIEFVYLNHPETYDVPKFLEWFKANGQMKAVDIAFPICKQVAKLRMDLEGKENAVVKRDQAIDQAIDAKINAEKEVARLNKVVAMYREFVTKDDLAYELTVEQLENALVGCNE